MPQESDLESITVDSITTEVVKKIANMVEADPLELEPPLYAVIDIDAVERLFATAENAPGAGTLSLTFEYQGYQVVIEHEDEAVVSVTQTN